MCPARRQIKQTSCAWWAKGCLLVRARPPHPSPQPLLQRPSGSVPLSSVTLASPERGSNGPKEGVRGPQECRGGSEPRAGAGRTGREWGQGTRLTSGRVSWFWGLQTEGLCDGGDAWMRDWGGVASGLGWSPSCTWAEETPPRDPGGSPAQQGTHRQRRQQPGVRQAPGGAGPVWSAGGHRSPAHGPFSWSPYGPPEAPAEASGAQGPMQPPGLPPGRQAWHSCAVACVHRRVRTPASLCPCLSRPCLRMLLPPLPFAPAPPWAPWVPSQASLVRVPPPPGWL